MDKYGIESYQPIEIKGDGKFRIVPEDELKLLILLANRSGITIGSNKKDSIASTIKSYREKLGLTQTALAEKLKITKASMNRIEKGVHTPSTQNLDQICQILGFEFEQTLIALRLRNNSQEI